MCDNEAFDDMISYERRSGELSRRRFGALAAGVGLTFALPRLADAAEVSDSDVEIETSDGIADAYFVHPSKGAHPGVLIWPDIYGLRPAFRQMGKRLAESGYSVLVVNPFYRNQKAPVAPQGADFDDPPTRAALMKLAGALNAATALTDANAFVAYLDGQAAIDKKRKMGTMGYCMGGPLTVRTAAAFPDRVGAGASFHGANLVTDKANSPHLLVPKLKAQYLFAIAENDDKRQPEAKDVLRQAFAKANLPAEIEVYAGALHGWCPPDSKVYDEAKADKAWSRVLALFKAALA